MVMVPGETIQMMAREADDRAAARQASAPKSVEEMRQLLREQCDRAGSQRAWADANTFSDAYICDVLKGARGISPELAKALGYEHRHIFYKIPPAEALSLTNGDRG